MLAPAAFGGSVVAGVAAMLVSGYRIVDCIQFRSGPGACDQVISENALPLVAGVAAIAGSFGGLWTYNPALRKREDEPVAGRTESVPAPEPPIKLRQLADVEESLREAFRRAIANGDVEPVAGPVDDPDQEPPDRADLAHQLRAQGLTQQEIADQLGVSRSTVQRLLQQQ